MNIRNDLLPHTVLRRELVVANKQLAPRVMEVLGLRDLILRFFLEQSSSGFVSRSEHKQSTHIDSTLDEHPVAQPVNTQHLMQSIRLVPPYSNLVSRDNIPEPNSILRSNGLEPRVVYGPAHPPRFRDGEEVVEVGRVRVGGGSVDGRPAGKVFEGGRHGWSLDARTCQGEGRGWRVGKRASPKP